jgi:hypothetical protein
LARFKLFGWYVRFIWLWPSSCPEILDHRSSQLVPTRVNKPGNQPEMLADLRRNLHPGAGDPLAKR